MEERRRTPKKPENPVREWISDNFRYILLIACIVLIMGIVFLTVRFFSSRGAGRSEEETRGAAVTQSAESSAAGTEQENSEENAAESSAESGETSEGIPQENTDASNTESVEITREADAGTITTLIRTYFEGLSSRNPELVRSCVDTLSEEDAQQVAENAAVTAYTDVEVYTCEGMDDSSRIAFVSYNYTMSESDAVIPGLTQFYVYDTGNGDWRLASDTSEAAVQQKIQELTESEAVQAMITQVQQRYEQVLAEHPELQ